MTEMGREYIRFLLCLAGLIEGPEIAFEIARQIEGWRDRARRRTDSCPGRRP